MQAAQNDPHMLQLEVNIDDMNPEAYNFLLDCLFKSGANDAWLTPIIMKKGRPAIKLSVLYHQEKQSSIENIIFTHTTTFGLRYFPVTCHRLAHQFQVCKTPWGVVHVREGFLDNKRIQISPEYEDCVSLAKENNCTLQEIYQYVYRQYPLQELKA